MYQGMVVIIVANDPTMTGAIGFFSSSMKIMSAGKTGNMTAMTNKIHLVTGNEYSMGRNTNRFKANTAHPNTMHQKKPQSVFGMVGPSQTSSAILYGSDPMRIFIVRLQIRP